ncbi:hypothetical protein [Actinopolymorpha alba]|nr:hypothetical protein [Actinopolymorpha alba]
MSEIEVVYHLPKGLTQQQIGALVRAGDRCKVHHTIEKVPTISVSVQEL